MTHWWLLIGCWFTTKYVRYRFQIESKQPIYNQALLTLMMFRLRIYSISFITWEIIFRLFWWKLIKNNTYKYRSDFKHFVSNGNFRFSKFVENRFFDSKHLGNIREILVNHSFWLILVNLSQASILVYFREIFIPDNLGNVKIFQWQSFVWKWVHAPTISEIKNLMHWNLHWATDLPLSMKLMSGLLHCTVYKYIRI